MRLIFAAFIPRVAAAFAPLFLGFCVGLGVAIFGVWRWFVLTTSARGRGRIELLRHVGFQHLAAGVVLTVGAAGVLARYAGEGNPLPVVQQALSGLGVGMVAGVGWVYTRGLRQR